MHEPVLLREVIELLKPKQNQNYIDCTYGLGGHAQAILEKIKPQGKILGIEAFQTLVDKHLSGGVDHNVSLACGNFRDLTKIAHASNFKSVDGILFDLGMSSWQIEHSGLGYSFLRDEPLIMNANSQELTAYEIVNSWPKQDIVKILFDYGQEKFARRIAEAIVAGRRQKKIKTTFQLNDVIKQAVPLGYQRRKIHFATKTYQALRIAANDELNNLAVALEQAVGLLKQDGKIAVISFHSLEDRIVKNFFRDQAKQSILKLLTKKPIRPAGEEITTNKRSRSARLRVAQKL